MGATEVREKVLKFESFINDVLKEDLRMLNIQHDFHTSELSEWVQLKSLIGTMMDSKLETFKGKMDIGCNIFAQVQVPSTSNIIIYLGAGTYAEFTLEEALKIIEPRIKLCEQQLEAINNSRCEISARIKLVLHGIQELEKIK